jgi:hypothetical protein
MTEYTLKTQWILVCTLARLKMSGEEIAHEREVELAPGK